MVSWAPATGSTTYRVLRSQSPTTAGADIGPAVTATSVTDRGLTPGATYYYQVIAVFGDGTSAAAAAVAFTVPTVTIDGAAKLAALQARAGRVVGLTPAAVAPRTIPLRGFTATGGFTAVAPRTIPLRGFKASGAFIAVAPRTIPLRGFTGSGGFMAVAPRTIPLRGFTANGGYVAVTPRTITLAGWMAVGPGNNP